MTKKEQAAFIWEHQYLIVKKPENLTDQDQQDLKVMLEIAPDNRHTLVRLTFFLPWRKHGHRLWNTPRHS